MIEPASEEQLHPSVRGGVALWTLFLGFTMLMVGNGLNLAVLGVRMVMIERGLPDAACQQAIAALHEAAAATLRIPAARQPHGQSTS